MGAPERSKANAGPKLQHVTTGCEARRPHQTGDRRAAKPGVTARIPLEASVRRPQRPPHGIVTGAAAVALSGSTDPLVLA
eukprot:15449253-Alexandrium_andersonii.AAC.1